MTITLTNCRDWLWQVEVHFWAAIVQIDNWILNYEE